MGRLQQVVVDCAGPAALARFWAAALDDFEVRPYDDAEVARLAALGRTPETDPGVILDGPHVELCFQEVDLDRGPKTPVHLDLAAADWLAEVDRLTALGATVHRRFERHAWMRDPEGNDFCVVAAPGRQAPVEEDPAHLGVVRGGGPTGVEVVPMTRQAVSSGRAPAALGPYSQAIVAGGFVFCSGMAGIDPATGQAADGIEAQTEQALVNLAGVLESAGSSMADLVKVTIFYADVDDFARLNEVYARHMPEPPPARSAPANVRLPRGLLVSIDAIAVAPGAAG